MSRLTDRIKLHNTIKIWQSEDGIKVPGSEIEITNVTEDQFYVQLFHEIKDGTGALTLDDLYDSVGNPTGEDGIVVIQDDDTTEDQLDTAFNTGGDGVDDTYIEYYGEKLYAAAEGFHQVRLYKDYGAGGEVRLGYANVNYSVAAGRRLHLYYKLSKPSGTIQTAEQAIA
jgi:hypothetical protein